MPENFDLVQKANELRQQAENEPDPEIRAHLTHMADSYAHLARSQAWVREHPASASRLMEVFIGRH